MKTKDQILAMLGKNLPAPTKYTSDATDGLYSAATVGKRYHIVVLKEIFDPDLAKSYAKEVTTQLRKLRLYADWGRYKDTGNYAVIVALDPIRRVRRKYNLQKFGRTWRG